MKRLSDIFFVAVCLLMMHVTALQGQTVIRGTLTSIDSEQWEPEVYLLAIPHFNHIFAQTTAYLDTALTDEGGRFEFVLEDLPCEACLYRIELRPKGMSAPAILAGTGRECFALFEVRKGQQIDIEGDANQLSKSFTLKGAADNWHFGELRALRDTVYRVTDSMLAVMSSMGPNQDARTADSLRLLAVEAIVAASEKNNVRLKAFMDQSDHIYDKIVGLRLYDYDRIEENDLAVYEQVQQQLAAHYTSHPYFLQLTSLIEKEKQALQLGSVAPDWSLPDTAGHVFSFHQLKARLILLDFWASWCAPCRTENRTTVSPLFEQYKERGFQVVSVSMDTDRAQWLKAIAADHMSWVNVSDLKGMSTEVAKAYFVEHLPTTFLIDGSTHQVVAKNLRGKELTAFVSSYLDGKQPTGE